MEVDLCQGLPKALFPHLWHPGIEIQLDPAFTAPKDGNPDGFPPYSQLENFHLKSQHRWKSSQIPN